MSSDPSLLSAIVEEAARAEVRFGPFTSTHEGYGVLAEEVAELLEAIRANDQERVQTEAIQVSAVALRVAACCALPAFRLRSGMPPKAPQPA